LIFLQTLDHPQDDTFQFMRLDVLAQLLFLLVGGQVVEGDEVNAPKKYRLSP